MPDLRTDAQLVTAYTGGDRSALAGIYDRFSGGLYDTAAAMLRDRHEAADAMQDVFLIAAERMGQLREPERLKPWLYAILRNEVYRRTKKRGRQLPTDFSAMGAPEVVAPTAPDAEGEAVSAAELGELVRSAACGLDERDQLVLELSVRQGLQGADLAAALGVSADQSYTLVHRMRERVDRSLGALIVARAGRKDCADLADVLKGWDGEFTVLVRKRVARHIENCEVCERTKKKAAPLALLGAAPAFAAPPALRDLILSKAGTPGAAPAHAYSFDADGGFPRVLRSVRLPVAIMTAAATLLLGIGGGAIVAANVGDDGPVAAPIVTETLAPETTLATDTTVVDTSSSSTSSTSSSTTSTLAPVPGALTLSTTTVDLGANRSSGAVTISNPGGLPVSWSASGNPAPFSLVNAGGTLQPGESTTLTVALDRSNMGEGDVIGNVTLTDGVAEQLLVMKARVEHAPILVIDDGPEGVLSACDTVNPTVYVTYSDESALAFPATVQWIGPEVGTNQLKERGDIAVYGNILLTNPTAGDYQYVIRLADVRGNVGEVRGFFTIEPCPG